MGAAFMDHQLVAITDVTGSPLPHRYIADEQGVGKTAEALGCLIAWQVKLAAVISPTSGLAVWRREQNTWRPGARAITVHRPRDLVRQVQDHARRFPKQPCLILIGYDALSRWGIAWLREFACLKLDALVCDEAHRLKSQNARRTQLVFGRHYDLKGGIAEHVPHVLLLSGTPMTAYLADLWAPMHALWPDRLWRSHVDRVPMTYHEFLERFCETRATEWGMQVVGNKNVPELRRRLMGKGAGQSIVIRRTKQQVLDLPEVRLVLTPLDVLMPVDWGRDLIDVVHDDAALEEFIETQPHASIRARLGEHKLRAGLDFIRDWLADNPDDKLIIFGVHRHVLEAAFSELTQLGFGPVLLTGDTRETQRGAIVQRFQTNPACRAFIGQLYAAGEAITLHAASTVIFLETDWSATAIAQALARAHRLGQQNRVLGHLLIVPNSFDERVHQVCRRKALGMAALWGEDTHAVRVDHSRRPAVRAASRATAADQPA